MATVDYSITEYKQDGVPHAVLFSWTGLANGDDGRPIPVAYMEYADRTIRVEGTFGAGGTVQWQGNMTTSGSYHVLNDSNDDALSVTAAKTEVIKEITTLQRPEVTAGDGTTDLDVHVLIRRNRP